MWILSIRVLLVASNSKRNSKWGFIISHNGKSWGQAAPGTVWTHFCAFSWPPAPHPCARVLMILKLAAGWLQQLQVSLPSKVQERSRHITACQVGPLFISEETCFRSPQAWLVGLIWACRVLHASLNQLLTEENVISRTSLDKPRLTSKSQGGGVTTWTK